jgi:hypothetical protein
VFDFPVCLGLWCSIVCSGAWEGIVYEGNTVPYKDFVLDHYPFTDERMTGDLAVVADSRTFLDFDERTNARTISDLTSVKVDEIGQANPGAKFYIGTNA